MFQFPLSVPRLILLSGAYLLKKLENNWENLLLRVKKLLFLLADLIYQLKILTYHSIMLTQIINAKILTPQGWLKDGSVLMRDNKILEVTNCDLAVIGAELIDAKGMYVVPGGVEIHCHGGGGGDFMEGTEEAFRTAINAHMKHGTTSIFPTLSSSTVPMIEAAAETCTKLMEEPDSPVLGLHLEGHYLNIKMAGGQMPENIKDPDPNEYIPIVEKWNCIKRWDAAPELPGAMQFGKYITGKGIVASVAHTQAEFEDIRSAWDSGYTLATHFYNAMPGFHKRREYKYEGTVESIYLIDDMNVEVVADGIHVPPTILRLIYKIKGVERACVITDALACAASDSNVAFDPRVIIEDGGPLRIGRQCGYDGPLDPYLGAEGGNSFGGCCPYGFRDSFEIYGSI